MTISERVRRNSGARRWGGGKWPLDGDAYLFAPSGPLLPLLWTAIEEADIGLHQALVWVKSNLVPGRGHYHYRHEHILYGWRGKSSWQGSRTEASVWEADKPPSSPEHPTMKPIALMERAITNSSQTRALVIDPFLGSGTTMLACERLGRRCYGMEIDAHYTDVSVKRWQAFTGREAILEATGETFAHVAEHGRSGRKAERQKIGAELT